MTKKKRFVLMVTVLLVVGLMVGVVGASTIYDNWKGTMTGRDVTRGGHYYGNATGEVVFNYRKGQADFMLKVVAEGLNPGVEYEIRTNYGEGADTVREAFTTVFADEFGQIHVNLKGLKPGFMEFDEYEMDARFLVVRVADGYRVLTTAEGGGGTLDGAGSNRGE